MVLEKIKYLCKIHSMTIKDLEKELGLGNGVIGRWDKVSPKADNLAKVANYFDVSTDFLLDINSSQIASQEIISLAKRIQSLPPEVKELVMQQIKVYEAMDKK